MSGRGRHRGHRNRGHSFKKGPECSFPANSTILAMFKQAAVKLNARQDRHERLVKLSRDITIESKRIIFLLHSAITSSSTKAVVEEANDRLQKLVDGPIKYIGFELDTVPAHLHSKAVTAGLQEYVEARTLCSLMEKREIITHAEVQKEFTYHLEETFEDEVYERTIHTMIPATDYMLGLADLTGELMRRTINSISSGDNDECFRSCQTIRDLYTGFLGVSTRGRELSRKMNTTRANVAKAEICAYALRVRGGEAPPELLAVPAPAAPDAHYHSDDDGFFQ